LAIFLLKNTIWNIKKNNIIVFNKNKKIKKWINFLFVLIVFIAIRLFLTAFLDLFNVDFSYGENNSWILGCLFVIILIKIWTSPELLFGYNALYNNIKDENFTKFSLTDIWILTLKSDLNNIQDNELKNKVYVNLNKQISCIEKIALKEKWFRNNKTPKSELAEKLNIPKSHINFIFKYHSKISYADFVKRVRTYDAIALIESGYLFTHKLDALALKVGYSSYNPFFSTFKEITGTCPMKYNNEKIDLK
jgi:AraC-like DNA-binding protein